MRTTLASDTSPAGTASTTFNFDSTGRGVEQQQQTVSGNVGFFTNTAFTSAPPTQETYPNNRALSINYDLLYRKLQVIEAATGAVIAAWQYFGTSRVAEVALGNGVTQTMLNNARTHSAVQGTVPNPAWGTPSSDRLGYDGAGRFIAKRYLPGGINGTTFAYNNTNPVVGNTAGYDPASNKNFERALHAENTSNLYQPFDMTGEPGGGYDSINRLLQYQRGILSPTGGYLGDGGGSVSTPIGINNTNVSRDWNLDGLGNWRSVQTLPANSCSAIADTRSHNKLNEITQRTTYGLPVPFAYDGTPGASNGNLINDGTLIYKFDALNRLVQVIRVSDGAIIATYVYDAMNRRVRKTITNGGLTGNIPDSTTDYFYSGWQVMEERVAGTNTPLRQYVWGLYIDECIQLTTFAVLGAQNLAAGAYYLLQDLLYRAVALTNSTGAIVEAYDTDAYGNTIIFTAPGGGGNWFSNGATQGAFGANEIIFCGYRLDPEAQLYYVRNRTYNPALGRWIQRDPIWYVDGGNLYEYCGGTAANAVDPDGTAMAPPVYPPHPRTVYPTPPSPPGYPGWYYGRKTRKVFDPNKDKNVSRTITTKPYDMTGKDGKSCIRVQDRWKEVGTRHAWHEEQEITTVYEGRDPAKAAMVAGGVIGVYPSPLTPIGGAIALGGLIDELLNPNKIKWIAAGGEHLDKATGWAMVGVPDRWILGVISNRCPCKHGKPFTPAHVQPGRRPGPYPAR